MTFKLDNGSLIDTSFDFSELCSECYNEEPKVISLFSHNRYCSRKCWVIGTERWIRCVARAAGEVS